MALSVTKCGAATCRELGEQQTLDERAHVQRLTLSDRLPPSIDAVREAYSFTWSA
jgi:hypothetical protein